MKYIAIDIGGTFIKAALISGEAEIIRQWKVESPTHDWDKFIQTIDACVLPNRGCADGIAISMPGKIDPGQGVAVRVGSFPFFQNTPLKKILEERYGLPVSVNNDAKCAAAAECWKGAMRNVSGGLVYVIGTAIGGGLIVDQKVVMGPHFMAGELSNCLVNMNLPGFSMDNIAAGKGGTRAMLLEYQKKAGMDQLPDGPVFFEKVAEGNVAANEVFEEFCRFTASFFFSLQMILDMQRICIGGGISAQPILIDTIRKEFHQLCQELNAVSRMGMIEPEIVRCRFGNEANLIGAVKYLMDSTDNS